MGSQFIETSILLMKAENSFIITTLKHNFSGCLRIVKISQPMWQLPSRMIFFPDPQLWKLKMKASEAPCHGILGTLTIKSLLRSSWLRVWTRRDPSQLEYLQVLPRNLDISAPNLFALEKPAVLWPPLLYKALFKESTSPSLKPCDRSEVAQAGKEVSRRKADSQQEELHSSLSAAHHTLKAAQNHMILVCKPCFSLCLYIYIKELIPQGIGHGF